MWVQIVILPVKSLEGNSKRAEHFETCGFGQSATLFTVHLGQWFEAHFVFAVGRVSLSSDFKVFVKGTWRGRCRGKLPFAALASGFCVQNTEGKGSLPPDQACVRIAGRLKLQQKELMCAPTRLRPQLLCVRTGMLCYQPNSPTSRCFLRK